MANTSAQRSTRARSVVNLSVLFLEVCRAMHCFHVYVCTDIITHGKSMSNNNNDTTTILSKISDICPGVEYLFNQNKTNEIVQQVNVSDCENNLPEFTAHQGVVYGICKDSTTFCNMHVEVPQGMYVYAYVYRLEYWCDSRQWASIIFEKKRIWEEGGVKCSSHTLRGLSFYSPGNNMNIKNTNNPLVTIDFEAATCGSCILFGYHAYEYIVPIGYGYMKTQTFYFSDNFKLPFRHVIMVNIMQSQWPSPWHECNEHIKLIYESPNVSYQKLAQLCFQLSSPTNIFFTSYLQIEFYYSMLNQGGVMIYIAILPEKDHLEKLPSGLFNCSVKHYFKFQQYLDCNLKQECEDGRDETEHCPFSSPGCQGMVASRNKCLKLMSVGDPKALPILAFHCQMIGGRLASIKTRREQDDVLQLFLNYRALMVVSGYMSGWNSVPFMYSKFRNWADNTLIYNMNHFLVKSPYRPLRIIQSQLLLSMKLERELPTELLQGRTALCELKLQILTEFHAQIVAADLHSPPSMFTTTQQVLFICADGHVTHLFLLSDPNSHCGEPTYSQFSVFMNFSDKQKIEAGALGRRISFTYTMFQCDDDITTVHCTLVCDFRQDCPDNSDESFCEQSCNGFLCSNGQCVVQSQRCNEYSDCLDDSDEKDCPDAYTYIVTDKDINNNQRVYIDLDGTGYFVLQVMTAGESCPNSHYRCMAEFLYCLPVYSRCNGFSDCVYGEDEQDCDTTMCPGFYRCRASRVCVHGDHLCDGWGQCPQRDDELMCDMTCPEGCLCEGQSFLCSYHFPASLFPELRYVDAADSRMMLTDFGKNIDLVHLSLSHCFLINISVMKLPNLQFINLSNNHMKTVDITIFIDLPNLKILHLANNPLRQMTSNLVKYVFYALSEIDVSKTSLDIFNSELSVLFLGVNHLNLSFSKIQTIGSTGFKNMPHLIELDIRGNPVKNFPADSFSASRNLKNLFSSNYRLCCDNVLPIPQSNIKCLAPYTILLSCKTLMPNFVYRTVFWSFSASAILGNLICFLTLYEFKEMFGSNFVMTIPHLMLSDMFMGSHVGIAVVADKMFHGKYIQVEKTWTNSGACKLNGFLFILSREVSVLIILFITLDHIIILCFSGDSWRFNKKSTTVACAVTWIAGVLLAIIPYLPGLSHWGLDGQSGLCRLALFDRYSSDRGFRWFTAVVVVNCILSVIIVAGEVAILKRAPKYRIAFDATKRFLYFSVYLIGKVAVTDAVCWLTIGLVTMMDLLSITVTDKIHDAMVVFMLPLNSAVNPLLFMWTVTTQRRQKTKEEKLLEVLKSRLTLSREKA